MLNQGFKTSLIGMIPKGVSPFFNLKRRFRTSLFDMIPKGRPATLENIKGFKTNLVDMVPKNGIKHDNMISKALLKILKQKKRGVIMYEMQLDDLLEALENNGIDTSKLNIIEENDDDL